MSSSKNAILDQKVSQQNPFEASTGMDELLSPVFASEKIEEENGTKFRMVDQHRLAR